MLRKLFFLVFIVMAYVLIVHVDDKRSVLHFMKKQYEVVADKIKSMNIKVKVNNFSHKKKK